MAASIITEKELRLFAFDRPELNTLIDGVKFSSEDIERATTMVVDHFNLLAPPTGHFYTIESFPSRTLLCLGVWGWLLRGAAIGEAMNNLTYNADGVQINDRDKAETFTQVGGSLWQEYVDLAKNMKISQNIAQVFGTKHSEYRWRAF